MHSSEEKPNILIVDDKKENLLAMKGLLEDIDVNVITATSGNDALAKVLKYEFVLVLMDVQMPKMDGFETATIMHTQVKIPIIFMTAVFPEKKYISKGYEAGAVDYLLKPIEPEVLRSKVRIFLDLYKQKILLEKEIKIRKQREEELARSNQELDDFAYTASHDLKEPLRGIHNYSTFLIEDYGDKLDEEGKERLYTLTKLSRHLEDLINDLLYYSRVGRTRSAFQDVDLNSIVEEVKETLEFNIEEQDVDIRIPDTLPTVYYDKVRIKDVFLNFITNAVKYNNKEKKWIEIGIAKDKGRDGDTIYVRDNGIGIPEKHLESIFKIFKRLHGKDKYGGGTGAGLAIVKKIAETYNGKVWAESTTGQGTTFYFTLGPQKINL